MQTELSLVQTIALLAIPVVFAITVHEAAHGYAANRMGDPTARLLGRLTLNPTKHIDPIGTIMVPIALYLSTHMLFGWAKPVPITPENFKGNKRTALSIVALAGPCANLIMACAWVLLFSLLYHSADPTLTSINNLLRMSSFGVTINLLLMLLNLLPIPPLDGSRVVSALLPGRYAYHYDQLEPYGIFIILGLALTGILGQIVLPMLELTQTLLLQLFV